jgi:LPXTG-site transpeptidase (sortase) family protein
MRLALRLGGTLLIVASVVGLAALGVLVLSPEPATTTIAAQPGRAGTSAPQLAPAPKLDTRAAANLDTRVLAPTSSIDAATQPHGVADRRSAVALPITHVEIPAIGLSADVVPAGLVQRDGGLTWEVPAFKIGHAETTADAGQPGNAVLLGHVTSLRSGNVFADLDQVSIGQTIHVFADTQEFTYTVVSTTHVPRTDTSALAQDETPAVSLITCTGVWLPTIWDYTERLVVRAELDQDQVDRR